MAITGEADEVRVVEELEEERRIGRARQAQTESISEKGQHRGERRKLGGIEGGQLLQGVQVSHRAGGESQRFKGWVFPDGGIGDPAGAAPIDLAIDDGEGIDRSAAGVERGGGRGIERVAVEGDLGAGIGLVSPEITERGLGNDLRELGGGADEDVDGVAELLFEMDGKDLLHLWRVGLARREDDVAAGDERGDVANGELFDDGFEVGHFDTAFAEIDAAEKGEILRHEKSGGGIEGTRPGSEWSQDYGVSAKNY